LHRGVYRSVPVDYPTFRKVDFSTIRVSDYPTIRLLR
jgi:hypothetical protein